ncbi:MAG: FkbM family methyltransferase [Chitinophagaceae bacterium]|jgi:hypothetical protein
MSFSSQLYRILVPKPIRRAILHKQILQGIQAHWSAHPELNTNPEWKEVISFINHRGIETFPYPFIDAYKKENIAVYYDNEIGFRYVMHENKRLYFRKNWSVDRIQRSYRDLCMEQDVASPHRYLDSDFQVNGDTVLADFGAAEGNFSLSVVEKVKKIYLFECDARWVEALRHTFAPWMHKVEIIQRMVSDVNEGIHCTGDEYFKDKEINFLKIDVDGGEQRLLKGFQHTLATSQNLQIALCTYHKHGDEQEFTALLTQLHYQVRPSNGFMIFHYDKAIRSPYLRRALIRATKN